MEVDNDKVKKWLFTCWESSCQKQFNSDSKMRLIRNVVNRNHFVVMHNYQVTIHDSRFDSAMEYVEKTKTEWRAVVTRSKTKHLVQAVIFSYFVKNSFDLRNLF